MIPRASATFPPIKVWSGIIQDNLNRSCSDLLPQTPLFNKVNSQPTNRAPNEPAMEKNAKFGPNLVVFGQKFLITTGEIKSFGTHIREFPPRHLVHIGFWSGIGQNVQKMAIFCPK